jgi:hypothetical protein
LDYLNSSCGKLLLEPQRTNLALYSEQFDNAAWTKTDVTVTANAVVSPDGYINADAVVENTASSGGRRVLPATPFTGTGGAYYTFSVYVKKIAGQPTRHIYWMCQFGVNAIYVHYNMTTFSVNQVASSGNGSNASATITAVGNDWYRLTLSGIVSSGGGDYYNQFYFEDSPQTGFVPQTYTGNGTSGFYLYGWQIEAGAYATSYIPTLGAAVTRGADAASKTGISSLIGQTQGTLFVEAANLFASGSRTIALLYTSGSAFYQMYINASNQVRVDINGSFLFLGGSIAANTNYKIAFAYKSGEYALYINGAQISTSASTTMPSSLTDYYLGNSLGSEQSGAFAQALLFPTRLSNSELAALTA